jgi:hypothetical protein
MQQYNLPLALHVTHAYLEDCFLLGGQATLHVTFDTPQQERTQHLAAPAARQMHRGVAQQLHQHQILRQHCQHFTTPGTGCPQQQQQLCRVKDALPALLLDIQQQ